MKKGDVVWCWDFLSAAKRIAIYVGKDTDGYIVTKYMDEDHIFNVNHCEPFHATPPEFQPGEVVSVANLGQIWHQEKFVGFTLAGDVVTENKAGVISRYRNVRTYKTKTQVKPLMECFQLLHQENWLMCNDGAWRKPLSAVVFPHMLREYEPKCVYPDFLLEEVSV